jgi:LmbE family N-acetylglucosaminyl deacetylase
MILATLQANHKAGASLAAKALKLARQRSFQITAAIVLLAALVINAPGLLSLGYLAYYSARVAVLEDAPAWSAADTLLVVAPHPDDEVVACAGSILQALKAGARVHIVWVTSGDGFEWDEILLSHTPDPGHVRMLELGQRRMEESQRAVAILGVPAENLHFLGYPDGDLSRLLEQRGDNSLTSRHTRVSAVPYDQAVTPGNAYTAQNLESDFNKVLDEVAPTVVLAPSTHDAHPDHRATAHLVELLLARGGKLSALRSWIVHGGLEWPTPKGWHSKLPLEPPPRGKSLIWQKVDLDDQAVKLKSQALRAYKSQLKALDRFLAAFVRRNELLSPGTEP